MIDVAAEWLVIVLLSWGAVMVIAKGLKGTTKEQSFNATDVLVGCVILVLCGFAVHGLWTR